MKVRDIIRDCRIDILDDFPGSSVGYDWTYDDEGLLWSNRFLVGALDKAQKEFARRRPIHDATTTEICEYSVSAGVLPKFSIDSRILFVESVTLQSRIDAEKYALNKVAHTNHLEDNYRDWRTYDGEVEEYVEDLDEYSITLIGELDDADTAVLTVQRLPKEDIEWPFDEWEAGTTYSVGDLIQPATANGHYYKATVAGTSGGTEPAFPEDGSTIVDGGTLTWEDQGLLGDFELPEINARHHHDLIYWMAHLAYLKRDSETFNPDMSKYYEGQFIDKVGPRRSAAVEAQRQRMSNRRPRTRVHYR